jgi:hypothetical protein
MPMAPDKTFLPNTTMDFLGFEIDTVNHMIKLPLDKLERGVSEIQLLLHK